MNTVTKIHLRRTGFIISSYRLIHHLGKPSLGELKARARSRIGREELCLLADSLWLVQTAKAHLLRDRTSHSELGPLYTN